MKVLFQLTKSDSGSEVWTFSLAEALEKRGISCKVEVFDHQLQYRPWNLRKYAKNSGFDVLHTQSWTGFAFASDLPHLTTEHLYLYDKAYGAVKSSSQMIFHSLIRLNIRKSYKRANKVTAVSRYVAEQLRLREKTTATVVHNGIDTKVFDSTRRSPRPPEYSHDKINLLFVGNLSRRKGKDILNRLMKELGENFQLICGSGLRDASDTGWPNTIFLPKKSSYELAPYYQHADIFVFPSRAEGFGLAVAEAMSCGLPVVALDSTATPELVSDTRGGFLCAPNNFSMFKARVIELAENGSLRKEMSAYNTQRARELFSIEGMCENYIQLYSELIEKRAR